MIGAKNGQQVHIVFLLHNRSPVSGKINTAKIGRLRGRFCRTCRNDLFVGSYLTVMANGDTFSHNVNQQFLV